MMRLRSWRHFDARGLVLFLALFVVPGLLTAQNLALSPVTRAAPDSLFDAIRRPGIEFDGRLVFTGFEAGFGTSPWVSDGTEAGTFSIGRTALGPILEGVQNPLVAGNSLYFRTSSGTFRLNAGSEEAFLLRDGENTNAFLNYFAFQDRAYFESEDTLRAATDEAPFFEVVGTLSGGISRVCATDETMYVLARDDGDSFVTTFDGSAFGESISLPAGQWSAIGTQGVACHLITFRRTDAGEDRYRVARYTDSGVEILPTEFESILFFTWANSGDDAYFVANLPSSDRALYRVNDALSAPELVFDDGVVELTASLGDGLYFATADAFYYLADGDELRVLVEGEMRVPLVVPFDDQVAIINEGDVYLTRNTLETTRRVLERLEVGPNYAFVGAVDPATARGNGGLFFTDRLELSSGGSDLGDLYRLAMDAGVDVALSGSWVSDGLNDQGLLFEVGQRDDGSRFLFVVWFLYDEGQPTWLAGNVDVSLGETEVEVPMERISGLGTLLEAPDSFAVRDPIGTITIGSIGCDELTLDFALAGLADGSLRLNRLIATAPSLPCVELSP